MKHFAVRRLITVLCTSGLFAVSSQTMAAGFQLWEQDGASVGNYHAGYAAEANDASIAWYNPAGIPRIKNQQVVVSAVGVMTDFKYNGNVGITQKNPFDVSRTYTFDSVTAQGGVYNTVPSLHYIAPLNDWLGFGFSVTAPFGLNTNYGRTSALRYAATMTSITVADISPSLGFKITDKASLGLGFDIQRAFAEFNSVGGLVSPVGPVEMLTEDDSTSTNKANDTGYGYHLGALYEFTPCTRVGLSYHSQVVHHFSGSSTLEGPIADITADANVLRSSRATTGIKLPPYTALSMYSKVTPSWAFLGSVIYTQWNTFKTLTLQQAAGVVNPDTFPGLPEANTNIEVTIPENFHNTWNIALGANYYPTDTIIIRSGIGYDQTPVENAYRNVQLPDNNRYVVALGGHFQATKYVGLDVGWTHLFFNQTKVNPPAQVIGAETVTTDGHVKGGADVFSGQVVWDIV